MSENASSPALAELRKKLAELRAQAATIEADIESLESINQLPLQVEEQVRVAPAPNSPSDKVALFLDLFATRRDVYPRRWETPKTGRSGHLAEDPFVLLATAPLVGEDFDLPQPDTLMPAMPLSFKGRLIQHAGRLHRAHEGKAPAGIYDYLDDNNPLTRAM